MNLRTRLAAGAAAAAVTFTLFSGVVAIGAPEQAVLIAKAQERNGVRMAQAQQRDTVPARNVAVAMNAAPKSAQ